MILDLHTNIIDKTTQFKLNASPYFIKSHNRYTDSSVTSYTIHKNVNTYLKEITIIIYCSYQFEAYQS